MQTIQSVFFEGLKMSFVHAGVISLFENMHWNGVWQRRVGLLIGIVFKCFMALAIDGTMIYVLVVDKFNKDTDYIINTLIIVGLAFVNIGELLTNMGDVWSKADARKKAEEASAVVKAEALKAEQRHKDLIVAISHNRVISNNDVGRIVSEFKAELLEEYKNCIIQQIANTTINHTNNLDVMYRYNAIDHLNPDELKQARQ